MCKQPVFIDPQTTLKDAAEKMSDMDCGFLAIGRKSDGKLSGVVTDRDITIRGVAKGLNPSSATVEEIKTDAVLYCTQTDSVDDVAENMRDNQVYRLIVLDNLENKQLCGVVTLGDIVRCNHTRAAEKAAKGISSQQQAA